MRPGREACLLRRDLALKLIFTFKVIPAVRHMQECVSKSLELYTSVVSEKSKKGRVLKKGLHF